MAVPPPPPHPNGLLLPSARSGVGMLVFCSVGLPGRTTKLISNYTRRRSLTIMLAKDRFLKGFLSYSRFWTVIFWLTVSGSLTKCLANDSNFKEHILTNG